MSTYTVGDTTPLTGVVGMDVTGATIEAHVKLADGSEATLTATITDAPTGAFSAAWPAGGVPDVPGVGSVEVQVTFAGGQIQTVGPTLFLVREQYA